MTRQERSKKVWAKWQKLVSEQVRSGQSVAAFCGEPRLCAPHFFAWKKRLRETATPRETARGRASPARCFSRSRSRSRAHNMAFSDWLSSGKLEKEVFASG